MFCEYSMFSGLNSYSKTVILNIRAKEKGIDVFWFYIFSILKHRFNLLSNCFSLLLVISLKTKRIKKLKNKNSEKNKQEILTAFWPVICILPFNLKIYIKCLFVLEWQKRLLFYDSLRGEGQKCRRRVKKMERASRV